MTVCCNKRNRVKMIMKKGQEEENGGDFPDKINKKPHWQKGKDSPLTYSTTRTSQSEYSLFSLLKKAAVSKLAMMGETTLTVYDDIRTSNTRRSRQSALQVAEILCRRSARSTQSRHSNHYNLSIEAVRYH